MKRALIPLALIAGITGLVYSNTLKNGFHLDDFDRVVDNPGIHKVFPLTRHFVDVWTMSTLVENRSFRPLLPLSLSLNYAVGGDSLPGYHLVNIGIHALSAILVYFLGLELLIQSGALQESPGRRKGTALAAALIFAVHPVSGYPVNYICGRDLLLMQLFLTASLLGYVRLRRRGGSLWGWMGVLLLFGLSLLSKQNAVAMPALILLYEWMIRKRPLRDGRAWLRAAPFAAGVAGFFYYTSAVVNKSIFGETLDRFHWETSFTYGLTQAKLHLFHYGLNFLWPMGIMEGLRIEPARLSEPGPWLGLAFILSTLILAGWVRKTRPLIAFCILAYWALMAVTSSIFPPGPTGATDYASDYRPYPASMFLYLAGATAAFTYFNRKWFGAGTVVLVAAFSSATLYLNTTWKTEESFWRRAIERDASHLAHVAYARTQKDRAVQEKHLRQALQLKPHYTLARINLGLNLIHQGRKRQGLAEVEKAVEGAPDIPQHQYMLAVAYTLTGRTESAFRAARAAARLDPKNIKHLFLAGLLTQRVGRMEESLPYLNAVLALEPDYYRTGFLLGFAHQTAGRLTEAIEVYRDYLSRTPDDYQARFNLALALMTRDRCAEAIEHLDRVLELRPDLKEAHQNLATCHQSLGHSDAAEKHRTLAEGPSR